MARKSAAELHLMEADEALESFEAVSWLKGELAREAYDLQDPETKLAIDKIVKTLQTYATGSVKLQGATVAIESGQLQANLLFLAMEIVKDLAFTGLRVAKFEFPPTMCAVCGADIEGR